MAGRLYDRRLRLLARSRRTRQPTCVLVPSPAQAPGPVAVMHAFVLEGSNCQWTGRRWQAELSVRGGSPTLRLANGRGCRRSAPRACGTSCGASESIPAPVRSARFRIRPIRSSGRRLRAANPPTSWQNCGPGSGVAGTWSPKEISLRQRRCSTGSHDAWTSTTPENPYAGIAYVIPGTPRGVRSALPGGLLASPRGSSPACHTSAPSPWFKASGKRLHERRSSHVRMRRRSSRPRTTAISTRGRSQVFRPGCRDRKTCSRGWRGATDCSGLTNGSRRWPVSSVIGARSRRTCPAPVFMDWARPP